MSIVIKNTEYILADKLFTLLPLYCKDSRNGRELVKNKNLKDNYIFGRLVNNEWTISDGKSKKFDKILFKKDFIDNISNKNDTKVEIKNNVSIEIAPEIIYLDDNEKFRDDNNNIIEIETRGVREYDKIFFKVKDIAEGFEMKNLFTTIIDKRKDGYVEDIHYKYFNCYCGDNSQKKTNTQVYKKELFLTYHGVLRVIIASHTPKVRRFIKWITETLFTAQMGTRKQKEKLASSILGVDARVVKEVFNTNSRTVPCVYLFTLNTVKELRQSMNIDEKYTDESIVCKYGFTKDLERRTTEHISIFSKIKNVNLRLKYHSYVDPLYLSNAENDIKNLMETLNVKFSYKDHEELVIVPPHLQHLVKTEYEHISRNYLGHISELVNKIKELQHEIDKLKLDIDRSKYELELQLANEKHKCELMKQQMDYILLKQDYEKLMKSKTKK